MDYGNLALWGDVPSYGVFPSGVLEGRNYKCFRTNMATVVGPTPVRPKVEGKAEPEPAFERDETGCMAHIIYVKSEHKKMSLAQHPCGGAWPAVVVLPNVDWLSSLFPAYYITGVTLRSTQSMMYGPLRGPSMCFEKGCVCFIWDSWPERAPVLPRKYVVCRYTSPPDA